MHFNATHGGSAGGRHEPLFKIWGSIRSRCYQPCNKSYKDYGGRGIKLCDRWQDYAKFREDLSASYRPGLQIDRIDNDGDYEPSNIKWSTRKEQCRNRRTTFYVTAFGQTKSLAEWAEAVGVPYFRIQQRIRTLGWPAEKALTEPRRPWFPGVKKAS